MGCCSGNKVIIEEIIAEEKEKESKLLTEEDYLIIVKNNIYRVQSIISTYNKSDDIDIEDEIIETNDTNQNNKKYFRFYIIFQLTLGKLKTLIEDHLDYKNKNNYKGNNYNVDFTNKVFDIFLAKNYLDNLLSAEVKHNRKEVQELDKDMIKNLFIEEINLNI